MYKIFLKSFCKLIYLSKYATKKHKSIKNIKKMWKRQIIFLNSLKIVLKIDICKVNKFLLYLAVHVSMKENKSIYA